MKRSNIILTTTAICFTTYALLQIVVGLHQVKQTQEVMRPILEQIDAADIKVIRMECEHDNYIADDNRNYNRIFMHTLPSPEMFRIEGDTLVVGADERVVISIPSATCLIKYNGDVIFFEKDN